MPSLSANDMSRTDLDSSQMGRITHLHRCLHPLEHQSHRQVRIDDRHVGEVRRVPRPGLGFLSHAGLSIHSLRYESM